MKESSLPNQTVSTPEVKHHDLSFEKLEYKPNVNLYIFKNNVTVAIDTTGKNQKEFPEIKFGYYDSKNNEASMGRPELKNENINMEYISACIQEVSKITGINEFFIYPYGDDNKGDKGLTEQARMKLFSRYANIIPTPSGYGYILKI
jgi:hypothetical protein